MSQLKNRITDDMKLAIKAKDKQVLKAVRMILEAIKQKEISAEIVAVISNRSNSTGLNYAPYCRMIEILDQTIHRGSEHRSF